MAENLEHLFQGFSKLSREERLSRIKSMANISDHDLAVLEGKEPFDLNLAENFIENVVGFFPMPLGIAAYFNIDGRDLPIPMAVEETSIVAAASASAKWIKSMDGQVTTSTLGRYIIGQVQFPCVSDPKRVEKILDENRELLLTRANEAVPGLVKRGGGVEELRLRCIPRPEGGDMLVLHVLCDPCDAMGANLINQVCEALKPLL